jgi:hypothetical protein
MRSLPLALMHFVLNTCFHINIHAAFSLLDFLSELNDLEHDFIFLLSNEASLSLIDYSKNDDYEMLLVRVGYSSFWLLILEQNVWRIQRELS